MGLADRNARLLWLYNHGSGRTRSRAGKMGLGLESTGLCSFPAADFAHKAADRGTCADAGALRLCPHCDRRNQDTGGRWRLWRDGVAGRYRQRPLRKQHHFLRFHLVDPHHPLACKPWNDIQTGSLGSAICRRTDFCMSAHPHRCSSTHRVNLRRSAGHHVFARCKAADALYYGRSFAGAGHRSVPAFHLH